MDELNLFEEKTIYSLKNENDERHIGEYFQVIHFNDAYYLYYNRENTIQLVTSKTFDFVDVWPCTVIEEAPGGSFCIIEDNNKLYMLCGGHISNKEEGELDLPDLVWPEEKRTVLDPNISRDDRKNGMYLLESEDGVKWNKVSTKPVLHGLVDSYSCPLGSVGFDTSPCLLKHDDEFYYYGRLNTSLDERGIYMRKSKDLSNWSPPEKVIINNDGDNHLRKNYYIPVVFKKGDIFYILCPFFACCGTVNRNCGGGKTLLLRSNNGVSWDIIRYCLPHDGKYQDRINDVIVDKDSLYLFFRKNLLESKQELVYHKAQNDF